jgi:SAM-dependent methyltransferase
MPRSSSHSVHQQPDNSAPKPRPFQTDAEFDILLPKPFQDLSQRHWTPVAVAHEAARFLADRPGDRVLDVGCGPGKFCAVGAAATQGHFVGVEQRGNLVRIAQSLLQHFQIRRATIVQGNIVNFDFGQFDAFYLFNPFQENSLPSYGIDSSVALDPRLYDVYTAHVYRQLSSVPLGTRVATYWGDQEEIPDSYDCVGSHFDDRLRFWIKRRPHALLAPCGAAALSRAGGPRPSPRSNRSHGQGVLVSPLLSSGTLS